MQVMYMQNGKLGLRKTHPQAFLHHHLVHGSKLKALDHDALQACDLELLLSTILRDDHGQGDLALPEA